MKSLYPVLLLLVFLFSCEKKSAVTPIVTLPPVDSTVVPVVDTDVFIGSYYDSATGDNMAYLMSNYTPYSAFYVIHSAVNQIVIMKREGLFIGIPNDPYILLNDTFTLNKEQYYTTDSSHSQRNGRSGDGSFSQLTPDVFIINDSLFYRWSYISSYDCYDGAYHDAGFGGLKQNRP